jgi:hypothetical protein
VYNGAAMTPHGTDLARQVAVALVAQSLRVHR